MQISSKKRLVGCVSRIHGIMHVDFRWRRVFSAFMIYGHALFCVKISLKKRVVGRVCPVCRILNVILSTCIEKMIRWLEEIFIKRRLRGR